MKFLAAPAVSGGAYFIAAVLGLRLAESPQGIAFFWPAAGISVGVVVALGGSHLRTHLASIAIASFTANYLFGRSVLIALCFTTSNLLEPLLALAVLSHLRAIPLKLDSLRQAASFFLAAGVATFIASAFAASIVVNTGLVTASYLYAWQVWFRSDFMGILAVAPLIVGLMRRTRRIPLERHLEGIALLLILAGVTAAVVARGYTAIPDWFGHVPSAAIFPPLLLLSVRGAEPYASAGPSVVAITIVIASILGVAGGLGDDVASQVVRAQIAIVSVVACSLAIAGLVAERAEADAKQKLLLAELNHRVKNTLATVSSVLSQSLGSSAGDSAHAFRGRLAAMARTHSNLSRKVWEGLELEQIISDALSPYDLSRVVIEGPVLQLPRRHAEALAMAIHELATNAAKYGSLSNPEGLLHVLWSESKDERGGRTVQIAWLETRGPEPKENIRRGFGSTLIQDMLQYEIDARVNLELPKEGARCVIVFPLPERERPLA